MPSCAHILTTQGMLIADLFEESAPLNVRYFIHLARHSFYNGLHFFKYLPAVLIQAGCPNNDGTGRADEMIKCELKGPKQRHDYGTLSMAHAAPDTNSSQFFFFLGDINGFRFDKHYTCIGQVRSEHLAVLKRLRKGDQIISVKIEEFNLQEMGRNSSALG